VFAELQNVTAQKAVLFLRKTTGISEEHIAPFFRVVNYAKQEISKKPTENRSFSGLHGVISQKTEIS
jgi:hypothetical protein